MPNPTLKRALCVSLVGILALATSAEAVQRGSQGRPSGGSRPSAQPSRPATPSYSRPSTSSFSRSAPQRGSVAPQRGSVSPTPVPRVQPTPQPRVSPPSAPRYEQPSQPATPRYQPPTPRYEAPSLPTTPRYDAPTTPRTTQPDGAREPGPGASRYGSGSDARTGGSELPGYRGTPWPTDRSGPSDPTNIGRNSPQPYQPRVWQPDAVVDLSGAVRAPRIGFPSISGSRSGPEGGLASGRLARAGLDGSNPAAAVPRPALSANSLRSRYGSAAAGAVTTRGGSADGHPGRDGLSGARTAAEGRREFGQPTRRGDASARAGTGRAKADTKANAKTDASGRGSGKTSDTVDAHIGRARARAAELENQQPEKGHRLRAAGRAATGGITTGTGIVVGTGAGFYGGGWNPYGNVWDNCGWYWNSCWYGSWWWNFSLCWPYGSCWWYGPSYRSACYPWGYSHSYWGFAYSPWIYTTVVYETYEPAVVQQPAPPPPPPAGPAPGINAPAGAVPGVAPEIRKDLEQSADDALANGDVAFREGRYSDAVRHYARAVEFSPERGSLWLILSDALFATGDYHYAAFSMRRALELDATLLETLVDKHEWYSDPAEFDRHIAWAEAYLRDHVLDEDARLVLAANYLFARRFASASDALESAFATGIVETEAGKLVLERSRRALGIGVK